MIALLPFDDTYWGIETVSSGKHATPDTGLLMIPIEELKPGVNQTAAQLQWHFWWYLLRNWNRFPMLFLLWWEHPFDDTYWGIETRTRRSGEIYSNIFWWYLLRNWNFTVRMMLCWRSALLMIPIEELKLDNTVTVNILCDFWWYLLRNWNNPCASVIILVSPSFDDTYWGIETI